MSAEECEKYGIAYKVTKDEELREVTYKFAKRIAHGPVSAYAKQKAILNQVFYNDMEKWTNMEAKSMSAASRSDDFAIAVDAFLKKTKPAFTGK